MVRVVARQAGALTASAGILVMTDDLPLLDTPADTLIIAGGIGAMVAAAEAELVSWIEPITARTSVSELPQPPDPVLPLRMPGPGCSMTAERL